VRVCPLPYGRGSEPYGRGSEPHGRFRRTVRRIAVVVSLFLATMTARAAERPQYGWRLDGSPFL